MNSRHALAIVRGLLATAALALTAVSAHAQLTPSPLDRAHAHNDYVHARPLHDALDRGFGSVEVDIWLVDGALLVAHDRDSVRTDRTLEALYLAPLRAHIAAKGGQVHAARPPLTLLVDIKSHADSTWAVLAPLLARYDDVLTSWRGDSISMRPVVAVLSGKRPMAAVRAQHARWAALDGRLDDLTARRRAPAAVMPLVSDDWEKVTTWRGVGTAPGSVRKRVAKAVERAHAQGRRLRFWNTPDTPSVWQLLVECGVDLIGTDDLEGLRGFLMLTLSAFAVSASGCSRAQEAAVPVHPIVGTWVAHDPNAPFPYHLYVFNADGTMHQANPDAGNPRTSDSDGKGVWAVRGDHVESKWVELSADRTTWQYVGRLELTMQITVSGDSLTATETVKVFDATGTPGPAPATPKPLSGARITLP